MLPFCVHHHHKQRWRRVTDVSAGNDLTNSLYWYLGYIYKRNGIKCKTQYIRYSYDGKISVCWYWFDYAIEYQVHGGGGGERRETPIYLTRLNCMLAIGIRNLVTWYVEIIVFMVQNSYPAHSKYPHVGCFNGLDILIHIFA